MFENVNEISVIVSAIVAVAIGNIWYSSALFGNKWKGTLGSDRTFSDENQNELLQAVGKGVLLHVIIFFIFAKLIAFSSSLDSTSFSHLMFLILVFLWAHLLTPVIWEKKPISYFFIHAGYFTFVLGIGFAIISYWPW